MIEDRLDAEEGKALLRLARGSLQASLPRGGPIRQDEAEKLVKPSGRLLSPRGAFVTLRTRAGELRGCIGHVKPVLPLFLTVVDCAWAAATRDTRFPPVAAGELPDLAIEISVLSIPHPIRPEEVEVGRHGLIVAQDGFSGILLPQVGVEHGLNAETFLSWTCRKAGLSPGAWRSGAEVLGFEAQVFTEEAGVPIPLRETGRADRS